MSAGDQSGSSIGVGIGVCLLMLSILAPLAWWSPEPRAVDGPAVDSPASDAPPADASSAPSALPTASSPPAEPDPWERLEQLAVPPRRPQAAAAVARRQPAGLAAPPPARRMPSWDGTPRAVASRLAHRRQAAAPPPRSAAAIALARHESAPQWAVWPPATALLRELDELQQVDDPALQSWSREVRRQLSLLEGLNAALPGSAADVLAALAELQIEGRSLLEMDRLPSDPQYQLSTTLYSLYRRLVVWQFAHRLGDQSLQVSLAAAPVAMAPHVERVRQHLEQQQAPAWQQYLLLQELEEADGRHDVIARSSLTELLLTRLRDSSLSPAQRRFLSAPCIASLAEAAIRWAAQSSWDPGVLEEIERAELEEPGARRRLALRTRAMLRSEDPQVRQLAESIETHYRNANIRLAMTREMLNRLLVAPQPTVEPFRDNILGANVNGRNAIRTNLSVQLVPDSSRWHLLLYAWGTIDSRSRSTKGPVTLFNRSATEFAAEKELVLTPDRVLFGRSRSLADNSTSLHGMRTEYDTVPVLGEITRSIARMQHDRQAPEARRIVQRRASSRINREVDGAAARALAAAERKFDQLLDPLRDLQLEPVATDMRTTDKRVTGRGRLAGPHQLGAFTPRPQAPADCWVSAQVHQSAVNNLLDNLNLDGRSGDLREVLADVAKRLGGNSWLSAEELQEPIFVRLADEQSLRVVVADDCLELTIRFLELDAGRSFFWYDFDVTVKFQPVVSGLRYELARSERIGVRGDGLGFRGQVELRSIFSKVFARSRAIPLIDQRLASDPRLSGLAVTQNVIANGWLGVAIGPRRATAQLPESTRRVAEDEPPFDNMQNDNAPGQPVVAVRWPSP